MTTVSLQEDNFRSKAPNLYRYTAQVIGVPNKLTATTQAVRLRQPGNLKNQGTITAQGVLGHQSQCWETESHKKEGHWQSSTGNSDSEGSGGWWPHPTWLEQRSLQKQHQAHEWHSAQLRGATPDFGAVLLGRAKSSEHRTWGSDNIPQSHHPSTPGWRTADRV